MRRTYSDVKLVRIKSGRGQVSMTLHRTGQAVEHFRLLYSLADSDVTCIAGDGSFYEAEDLTIAGWSRSCCPEQCRLDPADAVPSEVPVSHIVSMRGLWEASHLSRLFKACSAISHRACRFARRTSSSQPPAPAPVTSAVR